MGLPLPMLPQHLGAMVQYDRQYRLGPNPQATNLARICWIGLQVISVPIIEVTISIRFLLRRKSNEALPRKCIISSSE